MIRSIIAVIIGIVGWFVVATAGNWILRALIPGYSESEPTMNFTLAMMVGRLLLGLVSSFVAGYSCAMLARSKIAPKVAAAILLLLFLPVHYMLWDKFPIWYHLFFLITLVPAFMIGAALRNSARSS